jgi:hypothetical protein
MSELKAGWVEVLGRQLKGDSDVWQRTRARGGKPFRVCGDDVQAKASRGAHAGARAKGINRKLAELMPEVDE